MAYAKSEAAFRLAQLTLYWDYLFWRNLSVLTSEKLIFLIANSEHYSVIENPEITLEANPDDLSAKGLLNFRKQSQ
jgi:oxygen-independent coproporphyrinogen-3 oxidase